MIWRKTMRELWLIGVAYLVILELLAVPVLLLWPEIYADLQRSSLFKTIGVDFIKRIGDAVSGAATLPIFIRIFALHLPVCTGRESRA